MGGTPAPQQQDAPTPAPQPTQSPAAAAAPSAAAPAAVSGHRAPGIRFPPRMTADGRRISMLPASEATAILRQWKAGSGAQAAQAAPAAAITAAAGATPASQGTSDPVFAAWAAAQRLAAQQQQQPGGDVPSKFATSVTRLAAMPKRKELSERDMELIELGGAAP